MKSIKMIALDLDGTTLNRKSQITERTRRALKGAMEKGVHIVVSTGRCYDAIPEEVIGVEGLEYIINSNGADITRTSDRKSIYTNHLSVTAVNEILELFKDRDFNHLSLEAVIDRKTYMDKEEFLHITSLKPSFRELAYVRDTRTPADNLNEYIYENRHRIENINIIFDTLELKAEYRDVLSKISDSTMTTSFTNNYEIGGKTTSKAEALRFLMERLNVTRDELMACGDSPNDEDMIKFAGFGVAMGNALPEVKKIADYVTLSNEEDGVAAVIEKYVL